MNIAVRPTFPQAAIQATFTYSISIPCAYKFCCTCHALSFLFIGKNIPVDIRTHELNYLLYKAYNIAGWWSTPFGLELSKIPSTNELKNYGPNPELDNDERYSKIFIFNEYKYECSMYIYIKNDLKKFERIKQLYIFNYKNHFNIDKIVKKC